MAASNYPFVGSIAGLGNAQALFRYARETGRVSVSIIDNSNGFKDGMGDVMAWKALAGGRFPAFSTGLIGAAHGTSVDWSGEYFDVINTPVGSIEAFGSKRLWAGNTDGSVYANAGATLGALSKFPCASATYGTWLPFADAGLYVDHTVLSPAYATGPNFGIWRQGPLGINGPFVFRLIGALVSGGATVSPQTDYVTSFSTPSNAAVVGSSLVSPVGTSMAGTTGTLIAFTGSTVPEADRTAVANIQGLQFQPSSTTPLTSAKDACLFYGHVSNTNRTKGMCANGLLCQGSQSAHTCALALNAAIPQNTLKTYFYAVSDLHSAASGGDGNVRHLVVIHLGTYNDMQPSANTDGLGHRRDSTSYDGTGTNTASNPAVASNTPQGCYNNVLEIITILRAAWNAQRGAGSDKSELFFLVIRHPCTHDTPVDYPNDLATAAKVEGGMRAAITQLMALASMTYNTTVVDTAALLSHADLAGLWDYSSGEDVAHPQQSGHRYVIGTVIDAIMNYSTTPPRVTRLTRC